MLSNNGNCIAAESGVYFLAKTVDKFSTSKERQYSAGNLKFFVSEGNVENIRCT